MPFALSQIPQGFNYQAIARNGSGDILPNTSLQAMMYVQSLSTGGTLFWKELPSAITTNDFGLFTLVVGTGTRQSESTVATFDLIDWSISPKFLRTEIYYSGSWKDMGTSQLLTVPYAMVAEDLAGSVKKLAVEGETSGLEEALFEVKNRDGQTIFAVYNEGVRIYVDDGAKGPKGGFAVGGFDMTKGTKREYLVVSDDSVRVYLDSNPLTKGKKSGFAVGGYDLTKGAVQNYLDVSADSVRIYVDTDPGTKKVKGGFAVGGYDMTKGPDQEFLRVTSDSVKVSKSLLIPRLSTYERDHLPFIPGDALIIFNTTEGCMQIFKNNVWSNIWCFNCAPAFLIQPVDNIICSGNNVNFFVSATGTNLNYQWQQSTNGGTIWNNLSNGGTTPVVSGATGYSLILTNVPVGYNNYKYRCIVVGPCLPNVTSNAVTLNVGSTPPVFTLQPVNQVLSTVCASSFSVASPGYSVSYKWQQSTDGGANWNNLSNGGTSPVFSGVMTATLSLTNVPWSCNNYKYRCIASNLCGADATSNAANLTIAPASILTQPSNQQLTTGCTASFSITTTPGYVISYQWQASADGGGTWANISNGGTNPVYSGVTTASLLLSNVPITYNNYEYRCVVSSLCGPNETSTVAILTLNTTPAISVQPINELVYAGQNVTLNISTSSSGYSYQWQESTDGGNTWSNLTDGGSNPTYSGVATSNLFLSNVPLLYNNYKYRCSVSNHYCRPNSISDAATISVTSVSPVSDIDGNTYNTVGIGSQLWMAENLKTTKFNDGAGIPLVTGNADWAALSTSGYCYYFNDPDSYKDTYGALYNWYTVNTAKLCPTGWHVPSAADWTQLQTYLGGYTVAACKMKESGTTHWLDPNICATNESGFTALPGGVRTNGGTFSGSLGYSGDWWSSTEDIASKARIYFVTGSDSWSGFYNYEKTWGMSVRCIKD